MHAQDSWGWGVWREPNLDGSMAHALLCAHGPGHNSRHRAVVKALGDGLARELDTKILKDQYMPGWDRVRGGNNERARLD